MHVRVGSDDASVPPYFARKMARLLGAVGTGPAPAKTTTLEEKCFDEQGDVPWAAVADLREDHGATTAPIVAAETPFEAPGRSRTGEWDV